MAETTTETEAALQVADRVAVFYAGTTVEIAAAKDFATGNLRHPYTQALWRSLPQNEFVPVPGNQPSPEDLPVGCLLGGRCPQVTAECQVARPELRWVRQGWVRCSHAEG